MYVIINVSYYYFEINRQIKTIVRNILKYKNLITIKEVWKRSQVREKTEHPETYNIVDNTLLQRKSQSMLSFKIIFIRLTLEG